MTPDNYPKYRSRKSLYVSMFLFAVIGFILFFGGAWLRLYMVGTLKNATNPYAGPPPFLTCLFFGGFGLVIGAIAGLFKRKN
jgi:hypothetical protein